MNNDAENNIKIDKEKVLAKIDEIDGYLEEIDQIKPTEIEEYDSSIEKRRSCERLLQISIECIIDICSIFVSNLKLGVPSDESTIFTKLRKNKVISKELENILQEMRGFRNILVHKYGIVNDELVFENLSKLEDFSKFKEEILNFIEKSEKAKKK